MKIVDTTTYFEERLMMNLRFNILNDYCKEDRLLNFFLKVVEVEAGLPFKLGQASYP